MAPTGTTRLTRWTPRPYPARGPAARAIAPGTAEEGQSMWAWDNLPSLSGQGLVVFRASGEIVHASAAFAESLGRRDADLVGTSYWDLTAPGQKQRELALLLASPSGSYEKEFLHRGGSVRTARVSPGRVPGAAELHFAYVELQTSEARDAVAIERALRRQDGILLELTKNEALDEGDVAAALRLVTEATASGLECERASVWLYGDDGSTIRCLDLYELTSAAHSSGAELRALDFPAYFAALGEDRTIAANDARVHPATREFADVYLAPLGIGSMLEAPIRSRGKLIGVLCSEHVGAPRTFSAQDQYFAGAVADVVARVLQAGERRRYEIALERANAELEAKVRDRTASLQAVLDSTGNALFVVDAEGVMLGEHSRSAVEWFGPVTPGVAFWDYLAPGEGDFATALRLAFAQVAEGFLPLEVACAQLPSAFEQGGRHFRMACRPVGDGEGAGRFVILIEDVSASVLAERVAELNRELPTVVGHVLTDRQGFAQFVHESERLLDDLQSTRRPVVERLRDLHTLKGTFAVYGLDRLSRLCHELESRIAEEGHDALSAEAVRQLVEEWAAMLTQLAPFLDGERRISVRLVDEEHRDFVARLERGDRHEDLLAVARAWTRERAYPHLAPLKAHGARIARTLGREVDVVLDDGGVRLPSDALRTFFASLVHCVRNAVDHGIEPPEEREASGKPRRGTVLLRTRHRGHELVVTVRDDGRGIAWDAVRDRARALGLPSSTDADLRAALVHDGLSTRAEATEASGRGVGLAATMAACRALRGRIEIESEAGAFTELRFVFDEARLEAAADPPRSERRVSRRPPTGETATGT